MEIIKQYKGLRRELYILFIGRIMTNMGSMIWPMFTLILNKKLGLSAGTIATYMLLFGIVALPVNLLGGKLADKYNKKNIIVICDLISVTSYVYCSIVPVTIVSILIFAIASLFQTIEYPSYDALVADFTTSADRDRAYSLSYLGANLGLVLSPTIGGLLFNDHLNLAFLINGVAILSSTILIFSLIKDVHREKDDSTQGAYEKEIDSKTSVFKYLSTNRVILLLIIASMFTSTVYNMWGFLMPMDMGIVYGDQGSVLYGTITSVNCIQVVICTAFITRLLRKIPNTKKLLLGESLILLGYLIFMLLKGHVWCCYLAIIVFTFGEIANTISASPFMTRRIPASHRGRIMSVQGVCCSIASGLLQMVIGKAYDTNPTYAWSFVIGIGIIAIIVMVIMRSLDKKDFPDLQTMVYDDDEEANLDAKTATESVE